MVFSVVRETLDQASGVLAEPGLDAWLVFTRETSLTPDPALGPVAGLGVTWHSAFVLSRTGRHCAAVDRYDVEKRVEPGSVLTLEPGTAVPGRGYIGLAEDVLVAATGLEWLSRPQQRLWLA